MRIDSEVNDLLVNKEGVASDSEDKLKELFYTALGQKVEASFSKESYADFLKKYPNAATILSPYLIQNDEQTIIKPYELPDNVRKEIGPEAMKALEDNAFTEIKVEVKSLKSPEIPSMIVFSEYMRRWHDMDMLSHQNASSDMLKYHTLVVNRDNPIIKKILAYAEQGKDDVVKTLCSYIHDLSLLEQKPFSGKELKSFINKANQVLSYLSE
jgi:molecular chaperone HtpG